MDEVFKNIIDRSITSINIPEVTKIREYAFYNCKNLVSAIIPESVLEMGTNAFNGCSNLTSINLPNGLTTISQGLFSGCSKLTSMTIPSSITLISSFAFSACSSLTTITMQPTTPPTLQAQAFPANLTTINVPSASLSAYQSANEWSNYASKMVGV